MAIQRILVAIGEAGTQVATSECSLDCAGELARRKGATVSMLRVHTAREAPSEMEGVTPFRYEGIVEEYLEADREQTNRTTAKLASLHGKVNDAWGVDAEPTERRVEPGELAEAVRAMRGDLLIARFGSRPCAGSNLAEVSEKIVRRMEAPVLFIPAGTCPLLRGVDRVLVPLDGSPAAERILEAAVALLADPRRAVVTLLAVVPGSRLGALRGRERATSTRERAEEYLAGVAPRLRLAGIEVEMVVREDDDPASAILEEGARVQADVIAMVTGAHPVSRLVFGSTAHRVLEHLDRPLLIASADLAADIAPGFLDTPVFGPA